MRYLRFNNIYLDTQNQLLVNAGETIELAPKVYQLLLFFCQNSQRVISKDELMTQVWSGTVVTENAISRTLVKVRKALGDDSKSPNIITTVPRKGYRMLAEFEATDKGPELLATTDEIQQTSGTKQVSSTHKVSSVVWLCLAVTLLLSLWMLLQHSNDLAIPTKQIKSLTRDVDKEEFPSVSADLTTLAYTKMIAGKLPYINIENLHSGKKQSISFPEARITKPVWAPNSNKLAFLFKHKDLCTIYLTSLEQANTKSNWQPIAECSGNSNPQFMFSPNEKYFYFNDRSSTTNGHQIFRIEMATQQKEIVNQPITAGRGNYDFDISPDGEKLVILNSEFAPVTRIYTLNIEDSELAQTAVQPYLMRSVIWHHDSESIIHPSPHPAYELWQSSLNGEKLSVVASNTSRVKHVARINNGKDFTFVSYLLNRDINFTPHIATASRINLDNSSVMDYLPSLANTSNQYAFVSKRTSGAEVYLSGMDKNSPLVQLTKFNNPVKLYHLAFSPDDSKLLVLADNQIFLVEIATQQVSQLALGDMAIEGISWLSNSSLIFSTIKSGNWQIVTYDLINKEVSELSTDYAATIYSQENQQYYLLRKNSSEVLELKEFSDQPKAISLNCDPLFIDRKLNLQTIDGGVTCYSSQQNSFQSYSFETGQVESANYLPTKADYDINSSGTIFTSMKKAVADIMQTSSQ